MGGKITNYKCNMQTLVQLVVAVSANDSPLLKKWRGKCPVYNFRELGAAHGIEAAARETS